MTEEPKVPDQDFAGLVDAFRDAVTRVLSLPTDANIEREDAARSALLARYEAMRDREWQPIETAPKDGTRFLACGGGCEGVEATSWNNRIGAWSTETSTLDDFDDEPEGYNRPTYWMPLPAPPARTSLSQAKREER